VTQFIKRKGKEKLVSILKTEERTMLCCERGGPDQDTSGSQKPNLGTRKKEGGGNFSGGMRKKGGTLAESWRTMVRARWWAKNFKNIPE